MVAIVYLLLNSLDRAIFLRIFFIVSPANHKTPGVFKMPVSESVMKFFAYFAICAFGTIVLVIALVTYQNQGLDTSAINIGLAFFVLLDVIFFAALAAALKGWIGGKSQTEEP